MDWTSINSSSFGQVRGLKLHLHFKADESKIIVEAKITLSILRNKEHPGEVGNIKKPGCL